MKRPPRRIPPLGPPKRNARERVLAAWRGADLVAEEKALQRREKRADALVPAVLADLRLEQRRAEAEIVRVWNHLLDPLITAHAQPAGLHKGTLFVNVDSNAWLSEIVRYRRKEILDRLQNSFGKQTIARMSFRVQ